MDRKPGYNLITDMADEAIGYIKEAQCRGARQAVLPLLRSRRKPLAAPAEGGMGRKVQRQIDMGWNALRDQIFANQKRLGVIPANAKLTSGRIVCRSGTRFRPTRRKLFARQAEVYAGYTAYTDNEIGRVIQAVD